MGERLHRTSMPKWQGLCGGCYGLVLTQDIGHNRVIFNANEDVD